MITRYNCLLTFVSFRTNQLVSSKLVLPALSVILLVAGSASPMLAATEHVTSLADDGSPGTLRAVMAAAAPGDTIVFNVTGTITLTKGPLEINKAVVVSGPGKAKLFISGASTFTVLQVNAGVAAVLSGITIERGNATSAGGGGINNRGALALTQSAVTDNIDAQDGADGEGIYNSGILMLLNSTVSDNISSNDGAGIYNSGTLMLTGSTISNNGGGLPGASGGGIYNSGSGNVTVISSTVSDNGVHDGGEGGGIYNGGSLKVMDSNVSDNDTVPGSGAGIYNSGALEILNSTFSGNSAFEDSNGGAIANSGIATVMKSTFSDNSTDGGFGGAIVNNAGTLAVINSTLSGNSANDGGRGGAISNLGGTVAISFSTLSGDSATEGGAISNDATLRLKSTLLAGQSSGGNCFQAAMGSAFSDGYNLSDDSTCTFLTQIGDQNDSTTARLSPSGLQHNGGPTKTIALLPTSSAVNAIPVSACADTAGNRVTTDQRGVSRPQGPACDIGAYESVQNQ
jgi:fibronectin-binding autotransporter adhesin